MAEMQVNDSVRGAGRLGPPGIRRVVEIVVGILAIAGLLFGTAGRLDWLEGWILLVSFVAWTLALAAWVSRHDPALLDERGRAMKEYASRDERLLIGAVMVLEVALFGIAGLDERYGWSAMPVGVEIIGWLLIIPPLILTTSVFVTNTYASVVARVQTERGHRVISSGPYRYIRHPMYAGNVLVGFALPLALGSWWALIPGALFAALFVYRTAQEDRLLQRDLEGYADYAARVRYRLLPGVW